MAYKDKRTPEAENDRAKAYYANLREKVLDGYGGYCNCCGESERVFLAIDHTKGGGTAARKKEGYNYYRMYREIIRDGFPDTYQLLCHNCNFAKWRLGRCPHELQ